MPVSRVLTADRGDDRRRLDLVLQRHLQDVASASRTRIQHWIGSGQVTVNGVVVERASTRAQQGDIVSVVLPDKAMRTGMAAETTRVDVLYEDEYFLAVNKPAGIVVHPTYRHVTGTLMNALLWYARDWAPGCRPSLVGRLDKLTSGIVVVAKTSAAHAALQRAMAKPGCEKQYLAVVYGRVSAQRGSIDFRLARDPNDRRKVVASTTDGVSSLTTFERLAHARFAGNASSTGNGPHDDAHPKVHVSLLRCRLYTGRMHQIRVHLAARGWPVVGDPKYGTTQWTNLVDPMLRNAFASFGQQALHAWRIRLPHPFTRTTLELEARLPSDFHELMGLMGMAEKLNKSERSDSFT